MIVSPLQPSYKIGENKKGGQHDSLLKKIFIHCQNIDILLSIISMAAVFIRMIILSYQTLATSTTSKCMMECYEAF
jgi:hypothetical protein